MLTRRRSLPPIAAGMVLVICAACGTSLSRALRTEFGFSSERTVLYEEILPSVSNGPERQILFVLVAGADEDTDPRSTLAEVGGDINGSEVEELEDHLALVSVQGSWLLMAEEWCDWRTRADRYRQQEAEKRVRERAVRSPKCGDVLVSVQAVD
jgi:hypothetical protein